MNKQQVRKLHDASTEAAAKGALTAMAEEDRNTRVAALRVIESLPGRDDFAPAAETSCVQAVLKALSDPKRRVRWNAARCAGPFMDHPDVLARIQAIAEDESEKRKIRFTALFQLSDARAMPEPQSARSGPEAPSRRLPGPNRAQGPESGPSDVR